MNHKDNDPGGDSRSPRKPDWNRDDLMDVEDIEDIEDVDVDLDLGHECFVVALRLSPPGVVYAFPFDGIQWWPDDSPPVQLANFRARIRGIRRTAAGNFFLIEGRCHERSFSCVVRFDEFYSFGWVSRHVGPEAVVCKEHLARLATAIETFSGYLDELEFGVPEELRL